jgi:hypothetical protein
MSRSLLVNALVAPLLVVAVATVIGMVTLWPREGGTLAAPAGLGSGRAGTAGITGLREARCGPSTPFDCVRVEAELESGKRTSVHGRARGGAVRGRRSITAVPVTTALAALLALRLGAAQLADAHADHAH